MAGFAVVDFETTGFAAEYDRVVEVGLVLLSAEGDIDDEWSTLINPHRDVGATERHGIRARDVLARPPSRRSSRGCCGTCVGGFSWPTTSTLISDFCWQSCVGPECRWITRG